MKKIIIPVAVVSMMLASSCAEKTKEQQQQAMLDASKQELATAVEQRDQLITLVNDITTDMEQIKALENILTTPEDLAGESGAQRSQIKNDLVALQKTLGERREQLAQLEAKLKKSNLFNKDLQKTVENLRSQIDSKNAEIETLNSNLAAANVKIGTLNTAVDSLSTTVEQVSGQLDEAQAASTQLANELNTCYYIAAPKNKLKENKIVESGFLRKTKIMKGDFDKDSFVNADKRNLKVLPLSSKKAKVLTNHPDDSYEIVEIDGDKVLSITSPDRFWSLSNYLVIQTD